MESFVSDPELPIKYNPVFREYGIRYLNGGTSSQLVSFCPWCGTRLPESLRDQWFDSLAELGLEPEDPGVPADMRSDEWWKGRGL
jgi:hypothetical protein